MSSLYLLALLVTAIGWAVARKTGRPFPTLAPVFVGMVLSYGLALAALCIDPYYDDNGLPEFIDWHARWLWAAEFAGWFSFVVVPLTLAAQALWHLMRRKSRP